jgi:uncharacterized protein (TIGR02757 family)
MISEKIAAILDEKFAFFNHPRFIEHDPIQIPHRFSRLQDREIMGFWVAILAWGQRKTILQNAQTLIDLMDGKPYDFILGHQASDLKRFVKFKHRTFQYPDTLYFIDFFQRHYQNNNSLETAFNRGLKAGDPSIENGLNGFYDYFFQSEWAPERTKKHIASPKKQSACKRINMFLRWMVRKDEAGVDFGLWSTIQPAQLVCPLDVHAMRTAAQLGLMQEEKANWKTALALTETLRELDPTDPVKYDFALYGMGIEEKTLWN